MGTNKVASVILFDVSQDMNTESDNGETFFHRSRECLKRMILRKMFSQDNDDLGIILFGSDDTENDLARSSLYNYITVFSHIALPNWELFRRVEKVEVSSRKKSDWVEALVVALDFLKNETQGRRYRSKQIVVFSSFSGEMNGDEESVQPLVKTIEGDNVSLIVVGNEINVKDENIYSQCTSSLKLIFNAVSKLDSGIHYSFSEIEKELMYFEKKRKMSRLLKVNLSIGSDIQLPVRWMKVTNEETRFKWNVPPEALQENQGNPGETSHEKTLQFVTDTVKCTNFGGTLVELSYADIEAMSRKTGAPSFVYIGSVKSSKISRSMFVSNDLYVVVPDKDSRSVTMFSAFVDALIKSNKYGIARRVAVKNGKVAIGALLPVSDELGKAMYFLKLPFAEWIQKVPDQPLPEPDNEEATKAIDDLIDTAMLPEDLAEEGKGLLVRDPTFQSRCHALYQRAVGNLPKSSIIDLPESIEHIINPFPLNKAAKDALRRIAEIFPYTEPEDVLGPRNKKNDESLTRINDVKIKNSNQSSGNSPQPHEIFKEEDLEALDNIGLSPEIF